MEELWRQFEAWLSTNWPEGLRQLNPPATSEQISELEKQLGVKLPADFVACLKVHNGQSEYGGLFEGMEYLSLEEIHEQWSVWKGLLDGGDFKGLNSEPDPAIRNDWWNPRWIP